MAVTNKDALNYSTAQLCKIEKNRVTFTDQVPEAFPRSTIMFRSTCHVKEGPHKKHISGTNIKEWH